MHRLTIRYSDLDTNKHVNNAKYNTYLEEARLAFFRQYGFPLGGLVLARTETDYVAPIRLETEPMEIAVWVEKIGDRSMTIRHTITHAGALRAKARVVLVAFDYSAQTTRLLTFQERRALEHFVLVTD